MGDAEKHLAERLQVEAEFDLPLRLSALVQSERWPANEDAARQQNLRSLVSADRIRQFAPEEDMIFLQPPPFHTLAAEASWAAAEFWREDGALEEVDPERALVIGDFGLGSDAPIILQYGQTDEPPSVWRLKWAADPDNKKFTHWVEVARTFDEFAEMLGLD